MDRTGEYTNVLVANEQFNINGISLIQTGKETIIIGWNDSFVAEVDDRKVSLMSESDIFVVIKDNALKSLWIKSKVVWLLCVNSIWKLRIK